MKMKKAADRLVATVSRRGSFVFRWTILSNGEHSF
jgi:hypothetical protein